ncbi:hypothetical protein ACTU45_35530 [Streptomyces sp. 24-1644]|uniref:hypothetical protein n=1 Tax=Streptomyces sp. 24-1644 TaxID=3457315 RepID=UPI003FA6F797
MHTELRAFLTDQAAAILTAHGIDEPVLWEPPDHWCDGIILPIAPLAITMDRLDSLLAPGPTVKTAARELNLTVHQLHLLLESRGLSAPKSPRPKGPGHPAPRVGPSRLTVCATSTNARACSRRTSPSSPDAPPTPSATP